MNGKHHTLRAEGLYKQYGSRWVVSDVDIEVKKGEIIGLLGPNGAGKTTTFYMITGMIKPSKGNIYLYDKKITSEAMYMRARSGIGYLAQEPSIFGKLSVENNLRLVLEMSGLSKNEQNDKIESLLDEMSIQHIRDSMGSNLSGGERRRVEICRALSMNPDFILLDCLLYTSDAADEEDRVDLGGRRFIKKKKIRLFWEPRLSREPIR